MTSVDWTVQEVRKDFENKEVDPVLLQRLYSEYNDISDIEIFIAQAINQFPLLSCGVASVYLRHILGAGEIVQGRYHDNYHTFLLLKNLLIDITADQYAGPAVYIGALKEPWRCKDSNIDLSSPD
jgi:hypothetical protein